MAPFESTVKSLKNRSGCGQKAVLADACRHLFLATLAGLFLMPGGTPVFAAEVNPYQARYSLTRNGKLAGKVEIDLRREDDRWSIQSDLTGTHGLARILGIRNRERVEGRRVEDRLRPDKYSHHRRVAGIDNHWLATFDWQKGEISIVHDDDEPLLLDLPGGSIDPLTLKLEMRRRLSEPEPDLRFFMVEEDEIDEQNFRVLPNEWLETSLGCLETVPVEKIRQNSKRYTRAWHAVELANVEVRMEHGKVDGNHLEMRITELTLGDFDIVPRPGCSARGSMRPEELEPTGPQAAAGSAPEGSADSTVISKDK
jgi:hypothetical protein